MTKNNDEKLLTPSDPSNIPRTEHGQYRITYESKDGFSYSEISKDSDLECGYWRRPFPNTKGNSQAYGLEECLAQSDDCPDHFRNFGIERIYVERWWGYNITTPAERNLILAHIGLLWERYPYSRFGQLLENFVFGYCGRDSKLYPMTDAEVMEILEEKELR